MTKINILKFEKEIIQIGYNFERRLSPLASPVHNSTNTGLDYAIKDNGILVARVYTKNPQYIWWNSKEIREDAYFEQGTASSRLIKFVPEGLLRNVIKMVAEKNDVRAARFKDNQFYFTQTLKQPKELETILTNLDKSLQEYERCYERTIEMLLEFTQQ